MKPNKLLPPADANREISALIQKLNRTEQRLEELTGGEVDTVVDQDGRMWLLRRAQDHMRQRDAAKQAAILGALPANIALLDGRGRVVSVNAAWQRFAEENTLQVPEYGIGLDYIGICDTAQGVDASEAHQVAAGIRSVLSGAARSFALEYACHSPTEQRWFAMTVTLLTDSAANGVVVMHLNITERKRGDEALLRFAAAMDATVDAIYLVDRSTMAFVHVNDAACRMREQTREELLALGPAGVLESSRAELERTYDTLIASGIEAEPVELLRCRQDGSEVCLELRRHATRAGGRWMIVTLVRDITERRNAELALQKSEYQLSEALSIAKLAYWEYDFATDEFIFNDRYYALHRISVEEAGGYRMSSAEFVRRLVYPEDAALIGQNVRLAFETTDPDYSASAETQVLSGKGEVFWVEARFRVDKDAQGRTIRLVGVTQDISERKRAEERIAQLTRVYAMLSAINMLIVHVRDRDTLFRDACRVAVEQGGFRMSLIGIVDPSAMKVVPVASAGKDEDLQNAIKDILSSTEGAPTTMVARAIRDKSPIVSNDSQSDPRVLFGRRYAEAGIRSMAVLPLLVADEAVGVLGLYASEIEFFHEEEMKLLTELAGDIAFAINNLDKAEKLNYLAFYDALTGLANRTLFLDRVTQYLRGVTSSGRKLAVYLIDLERFKNINDSLGRPAGDALLRQVAEWLTRSAGDDNLVARVGSDHFAMVVPEVKQGGDVVRLLEKWLEAFLQHPFRLNDAVLRVSARVGVALYPDDGADAETLVRNAEAALKNAKTQNERYLFFKQKMIEAVAGKLTLENQLRQALDNEEFVLHYQPKVNLASGKLTSTEALIRWNNPRTGLVPPGHFIPILEETGLIYDVGRWALKQAVADYLRWRAAGLPAVRIAVNVSPLQLRHRNFIADIGKVIGIDAQAPAGLELEITESLLMQDVNNTILSLGAIRALGVTIAIDDFGTGFSSLSYLAKLPVDALKIDRSFVIQMTVAPEGLALVSTIIALAHSLKLKVVAEGVETGEQSRLLRLLGCDEMQGFLFSKPVPADIFETRFLTLAPAR